MELVPSDGGEARRILEKLYGDPSRDRMTPRQRVEAAICHQVPDRTPFDFWAVPEELEKLRMYLGAETDEQVLRLLGIDCRLVEPAYTGPAPVDLSEGVFVELWGSQRRYQTTDYGAYDEYACYPLAGARTPADVDRYAYWPEPEFWDVSGIPAQIARLNRETEYHLRYEVGGIFESAWGLFGLERFLICMASGEMAVPDAIMERYTDLFIANTRRVLDAAGGEIDMVYIFDDIGTQRGPLISLPMWRKYILPHHRRLMEAIRQFPVRVMYHSCGGVYPFIEPLITELGIDVLNPLQPRAAGMDLTRIKAEFGSRLAFYGGIDLQDTLPNASPARVKQEVTETCDLLGKNGGYICASAHHIQADTPVENVIAMYTASRSSMPDSRQDRDPLAGRQEDLEVRYDRYAERV